MRAEATINADSSNLANFLLTLYGRERPKFDLIEQFITTVFPEFVRINPEADPQRNTVSITLTERAGGTFPLALCGTGVEQILCLAAFVITGGRIDLGEELMFLLDEPHSYLHPAAERQLLAFLKMHPEHDYVIATHSPILVNAVPPSAITYVERGRSTDFLGSTQIKPSDLMQVLGYQNSDLLFHNRLVFVEGESDQSILPKLLAKLAKSEPTELAATGFPVIHGVPGAGKPKSRGKNAKGLQDAILKCEQFLLEFGRAEVPHLFLLDGDFTSDDRNLLEKLEKRGIKVRFLKRFEVENYLLDPIAIATVIDRELAVAESEERTTSDEIAAELDEHLKSDEPELYPLGKKESVYSVKGSIMLEKLFESHKLPYEKTTAGPQLADLVDPEEAGVAEIWEELKCLFE